MHVGVIGAGAIGGYLAAELGASGARVTLVHRPGSPALHPTAVRADGRVFKSPDSMVVTADPGALAGVDACLVAVKASAAAQVASTLAGALSPDAPVVTLQNGLHAEGPLRARLGDRVAPGIVTYNVYIDDWGFRRQATTGKLCAGLLPGAAGRHLRALASAFRLAGETLELRADIDRVILGKLLINLNNGVCAATGLGIAASLADRDARACFAHCLREGLLWMRRAGLRPGRVTLVPPWILPAVFGLPDAIVSRLARAVAGVRPEARFSTVQDLDRGRATEIDALNGAIVDLARRHGGSAPVNELVTSIVHEHEKAATSGDRPRYLSPRELRARIEQALARQPA
jgi:2-dehydropantoate 2-reductase